MTKPKKTATEEPAAEEMVTVEAEPEPKPAKAAKPAPRQPGTEYLVADPDVASLSFHGETYPVVKGKVFIPKGETWHMDLIGSFLKEEE